MPAASRKPSQIRALSGRNLRRPSHRAAARQIAQSGRLRAAPPEQTQSYGSADPDHQVVGPTTERDGDSGGSRGLAALDRRLWAAGSCTGRACHRGQIVRPQQRRPRRESSAYVDTANDPEVGLRAVAALRVLTERLEMLQVDNARALGWSWQEIASRLGVTKQTVHRKHGRRAGGR
jgi:hypothetical protein